MSNDLKMKRSVSQAMYRYLPGRWVDFYIKKTRTSYTAYVEHWNSTPIEGVNTGRIKREVWRRLESAEDATVGFAPLNDANAWSVMTPKVNDANSAVSASISPLLFACSRPSCKHVRQFRSSAEYLRNHEQNKYCDKCHGAMTQVRMIYYCPCGWAAPVDLKPCKNGCRSTYTRVSTYTFMCDKCHQMQELERFCPECGTLLRPRNALDNAQFYPQSFHLIDLVDVDREQYVTTDRSGALTALAAYMGFVAKDKFEELVRTNAFKASLSEKEDFIKKNIEILKQNPLMATLPEDILRSMAMQLYEANNPMGEIDNAISNVSNYLTFASDSALQEAAVNFLEYDTVISVPEKRTLDDAATIAVKLEEAESADAYKSSAHKLHFSNIQACGRVPFVSAVYGYCRKSNEIGKSLGKARVNIHAFPRESGSRSNIYATKLETEGILFEVDKRAILKWLIRNGIISDTEYSDSMDETELKAWFLNHCSGIIPMYGEIDDGQPVFKKVFSLLHTISHAIIRHAEAYTGLDKNSLAEYIFPNIPSVFIYCQNVQGFDLGAMFSAMESKIDSWLNTASTEIKQCIFDPVCQNDKGACSGCMYLGDITCNHFNLDLDRRLLIGHTDLTTGKKIFGFWED